MILGHRGTTSAALPRRESANGHRPLGHRINFIVCTQQRRLQKHPALQRLRIAHGGDIHIQPGAGFGKRGNIRCHHHHGHVLRGKGRGRDIDAITLEHVCHALLGVDGVFVAIAGQANHQPVADELVVARAGDDRQITHPHASSRCREGNGQCEQACYQHTNNRLPAKA